MKFVSVRQLCSRSAHVWRALANKRELVVTRNGKPIAIVCATDEKCFEQSLADMRHARAHRAVNRLQKSSTAVNREKLSAEEIEEEIAIVRQCRRR